MLVGTVATDPVTRCTPSGDEVVQAPTAPDGGPTPVDLDAVSDRAVAVR
jgi:hypothetical protein